MLRKRYEVTKNVRKGYEISYQDTKKVRSYEKDTKLRKGTNGLQRWYEITKKVRKGYEEVTK